MKKLLILFFVLGLTPHLYAQEKSIPKNNISVETGFFSRGIVGLSYSRKVIAKDTASLFIPIGTGLGFDLDGFTWGIPDTSPNWHVYSGVGFNYGPNKVKLTGGLDLRVVLRISNGSLPDNDYIASPNLGFLYQSDFGFSFAGRLHMNLIGRPMDGTYFIPGVGFSLGHSF